jgi:hypothetical protein
MTDAIVMAASLARGLGRLRTSVQERQPRPSCRIPQLLRIRGSTRRGYRDRCVERETERLPLWLGGSWSGWTVAGWVDEVLRPSAAACKDGEDFRLKGIA